MLAAFTGDATQKYIRLYFDGTLVGQSGFSGATDVSAHLCSEMRNLNSESSQACAAMRGGGTSPYYETSIATSSNKTLSVRFTLPTADHYMRFDHIRVNITPGV
jgi:hypothetical protein